ncbi:MAG: branched-chain amino acid transaminase [Gemmatimonadota bacterium]
MSAFPRTAWIWKDGEFLPWESATLHVMSHVVHYGSSVFEGMRCYTTPDGPAVFRLPEHIRRLYESAKVYRMAPAHTPSALAEACCELVRRNGLAECYIRPITLRSLGAAGVSPLNSPVETYIICWPWGAYLGAAALESGVSARVSSWFRPAPNTMPAGVKAGGNYLNSQLIKMEALADGYDEGIALGPGGMVSEGSGQNIFLVRDGTLITPAVDGTLLRGITRDSIIAVARDLGIHVREQAVPRESLYNADEAFFTGTAAEVTPIRSIDRIEIADGKVGPITRAVQRKLLAIAHGDAPDTHGWLTRVAQATRVEVA